MTDQHKPKVLTIAGEDAETLPPTDGDPAPVVFAPFAVGFPDGAGGIVQGQVYGVGIHVKYEFEFSSQLAQKGIDPFQPHIEVDLHLPPPALSLAGVSLPELAQINIANDPAIVAQRLGAAADLANKLAYEKLTDLITQARASHKVNS